MLSGKQREVIKIELEKQLKILEEKIREYKELTKPIPPENAIGRVSRMDAINNKSVNEAALRQAQEKQKNMTRALTKVDDEKFGVCHSCGDEIPMGRIMLVPGSTRCVRCAQ